MFAKGQITAYPTDTSFGLGVRADDVKGLQKLYALKKRPSTKFTSLMVKDWDMLKQFAQVPAELPKDFFTAQPRTVILKPTKALPLSEFWPPDSVAFRVATNSVVAAAIEFPITATSANFSGQPSIYDITTLKSQLGDSVQI